MVSSSSSWHGRHVIRSGCGKTRLLKFDPKTLITHTVLMEKEAVNIVQKGHFELCGDCKHIQTTKGTEPLFLKAVSVWINKPHVVNRRLCGSKIVSISRVHTQKDAYLAVMNGAGQKSTADIVSGMQNSCKFTDLVEETSPYTVIIRELIPKSEFFPKLVEAVLYDREKATVTFIPVAQNVDEKRDVKSTHELEYSVALKQMDKNFPAWAQINEVELFWSCDHTEKVELCRQISSQWLKTVLLEKLVSWSQVNDISTSATSLQLVEVDKYKDTYVRLKNTYGRDLVKNWTESTDPKKFVYEDVAIAAYLLLIWEEDRQMKNLQKKQSFVDLGCGNGLLVYILTKEGHKGLGIDLRKRKIWDTFGPDIDLREETIQPSAENLYPDYDWVIGNHSDELTPWIPVIAARSSYDSCFFVLPCCHHDFVGKYSLMEKGKSRYASYIDYVREIITYCGFYPECDTLRIPSTKRICFIGRERCYEKRHEDAADRERQAFIDKRTYHIQGLMNQRQKNPSLSKSVSVESESPVNTLSSQNSIHLCDDVSESSKSVGSGLAAVANTKISITEKNDVITTDSLLFEKPFAVPETRRQVSDGGEKRKFSDTDSGYSESSWQESSDSYLKRFRSECDSQQDDYSSLEDNGHVDVEIPTEIRTSDSSYPVRENLSRSQESMENFQSCDIGEIKTQKWAENFKPRIEPGVRNCQKVPDQIKTKIVNAVFQLVQGAANGTTVQLDDEKMWRKGGSVPLGDVASLFDKSTLQELKCECGGLQTLLRNHSHIFQVTGGMVQLRDFASSDPWKGCKPKKEKNKNKNRQEDTRKTTLCWFDANHPDGCPRSSDDCLFAHGIGELRDKLANQDMG